MLLVAAFLYIYYLAMKLQYELQQEQTLQGLVGVVGCAKDCSHELHSEMLVRNTVGATCMVHEIDTTVSNVVSVASTVEILQQC